ncbi:MAG: hypothetical protein SFV81_05140 [Pirellulaceae bacterium]|nr:hypothetical protein [Pirellulaceae bacterium]
MSAIAELTHSGMGAIPHSSGVAFRVWAPFANAVSVVGTFNDWDPSVRTRRTWKLVRGCRVSQAR